MSETEANNPKQKAISDAAAAAQQSNNKRTRGAIDTDAKGEAKATLKRKGKTRKRRAAAKLKANVEVTKQQLQACNNPELQDKSVQERMSRTHWRLSDKRDFPQFMKTFANDVHQNPRRHPVPVWNADTRSRKNILPYKHQQFVSDYMSTHSPYRGVLLYHGLGSGKTGCCDAPSVITAELWRWN